MQSVSTDFVSSLFSPTRYSAKKTLKPFNFVCRATAARHVMLQGDFNDWSKSSHPMVRQPDGAWFLQVELHHGHHQYRFLVDGEPMLDPKANGVALDPRGERASLIAVS